MPLTSTVEVLRPHVGGRELQRSSAQHWLQVENQERACCPCSAVAVALAM